MQLAGHCADLRTAPSQTALGRGLGGDWRRSERLRAGDPHGHHTQSQPPSQNLVIYVATTISHTSGPAWL